MEKHLHIVAHDVPYPADYGGVFDLFYKMKALSEAGVSIHLYCFTHNRPPQKEELKRYCIEVNYYPRRSALQSLLSKLPYMIEARTNDALTKRLLQDDFPILMEGLHSTALLNDQRFSTRKILVRSLNVEHIYYAALAENTESFVRKIYLKREARLLQAYERKVAAAAPMLCISENDTEYFHDILKGKNVIYLPAFLGWKECTSLTSKGSYCLYHGNLSVSENESAAIWLIEKVFNEVKLPLIIAGKNPGKKLRAVISMNQNCTLVENPTEGEMQQFVRSAQINICPSFNQTGIKLKVLNSLFCGRHCIVNDASLTEQHFRELCVAASDENEMKRKIVELFNVPFTREEINKRNEVLQTIYNTEKNLETLSQLIW